MSATGLAPRTRSQRLIQAKLNQISQYPDDLIPECKWSEFNITVLPLDLESPHPARKSSCHFFEPLSQDFLAKYPIDTKCLTAILKEQPDFLDIGDVDADELAQSTNTIKTQSHVQKLLNTLEKHICNVPRVITDDDGFSIFDVSAWWPTEYPHPLGGVFSLHEWEDGFDGCQYPLHFIFECAQSGYPHVSMVVARYKTQEPPTNSLMKHELVYILKAMKIRLFQNLFDKKQPQPVLMVSFMTPRCGRVLQAYIEDESRLVILRSRIYDFDKNDTAPFELFYRWLLADPIGMNPDLEAAEEARKLEEEMEEY